MTINIGALLHRIYNYLRTELSTYLIQIGGEQFVVVASLFRSAVACRTLPVDDIVAVLVWKKLPGHGVIPERDPSTS